MSNPIARVNVPRWLEALKPASEKVLEKFEAQWRGDCILYHYTNVRAMMSIVDAGELWMTDAFFMNDRVELTYGLNLVIGYLENKYQDTKNVDVRAVIEGALELFQGKESPIIYVACLTKEKDDLTQWRAYGDNGQGVCIGLNLFPHIFGYSSEAALTPVTYDREDQLWIINTIVSEHLASFELDLKSPRSGIKVSRDEEKRILSRTLYHRLWAYLVGFKHETFAPEKEVRYVYTAHDFSDWEGGWYPKHPHPRFRERDGLIIPYLTTKSAYLKIAEDDPNPLDEFDFPLFEVIVGPCREQDLFIDGIRRFLDERDFRNVAVIRSNVPFRN